MPPLRERGNDNLLLFRLFAMQMAEKYNLPKISLTEDAKKLMLKYKWPGNVRQLKNITEQMSVLSSEREINMETLMHFIPRDEETTQLATIPQSNNTSHSYENEREFLYKILYELRGNVSDLRREVGSLRKQLDEARQLRGAEGFSSPTSVSSMSPTTNPAEFEKTQSITQAEGIIQHDTGIIRHEPGIIRADEMGQSEPEEIEAEEIKENDSLNLDDLSKQMIEKALERKNGNRKKAAEELGISDRTLYRTIN